MQQTLLPDSFLQGGKYHIIKTLGQGGFGITYLAEHTQLEVKVAVKEFFMKDLCNRDEATSQVSIGSEGSRDLVGRFRQKFLKEARNIAKLHHPNIVRISDVFEENGTAYYVMDYCEGGSLSELVRRHPDGLDEAVAVRYIRQVASALGYIHQRKMMHLDIKPGNIMLDANDNAVVIDFGLSKQYDAETGDATTSSAQAYTEGYAPVEQYMRGGVSQFSPSTDIYALAATLYKLLTGQTPPNASIVDEEGLPHYTASPNVKRAIQVAMQKRTLRPQSITEWLTMLDAPVSKPVADDDEPTLIEKQKAPKPVSKKPWLWGFVALITLALVWLVWPKPHGVVPSVVPDLIAETDSIPEVETTKPEKKEEIKQEEPARKEESKVEEPKKETPKKEEPKQEEPKKEEPKQEEPTPVRTVNANGHDYVDLGLKDSKGRTIYWASCNVGASKPEDYGLYFAWGETKGHSADDGYSFELRNYSLCRGSNTSMTKYCNMSKYGNVDNKMTLSLSDDAAHVNWGGDWRMPTKAEQDQLRKDCEWQWDSANKGYIVKGPNGNSIFLPTAGCRLESGLVSAGSIGYYWSSSLNPSGSDIALDFYIEPKRVDVFYGYRFEGQSIRAVCVSPE